MSHFPNGIGKQTYERLLLFVWFCAGFSDAGETMLAHAPMAGVGEAPRHEVAGRGAVVVQRALWRFDRNAGVDRRHAAAPGARCSRMLGRIKA